MQNSNKNEKINSEISLIENLTNQISQLLIDECFDHETESLNDEMVQAVLDNLSNRF